MCYLILPKDPVSPPALSCLAQMTTDVLLAHLLAQTISRHGSSFAEGASTLNYTIVSVKKAAFDYEMYTLKC